MEHDNRNPKGDQRQPGDNSGASTGTKVKMYPYNVNGVRLSTGTKMEANHAETWKNELEQADKKRKSGRITSALSHLRTAAERVNQGS